MHMVEAMGKRVTAVRAFFPDAKEVFVQDKGNARRAYRMDRVHPDGLFEAILWRRPAPFEYEFRIVDYADREQVVEDAYHYPGDEVTPFDRYLFNRAVHYRIYEKMGANLRTVKGVAGVHFSVWAPNAQRVSVIGDFNRWDGRKHQMKVHEDSGVWELFIPKLKEGEKYKFEIKTRGGDLYVKTDPYGFYFEPPPGNAAIVRDIGTFTWRDGEWMEARRQTDPLKRPMIIYEVHLGSWRRVPEDNYRPLTYREAVDQLIPYVKEMGYTHIEMMPVMEHPFDGSWGYQVTGYYAPTWRYGTPQDFMYFVDTAHQNGIGVILDWVPAHFPKDAHALVFFDGTALYEHADPRQGEHPDWGTKVFNFGRAEVKNYLISNALFWLDKFHIDGLRVDAVASLLYLDYSRKEGEWIPNCYGGRENLEAIEFVKHLNSKVYEYFPGVLMIAEESTAWPMVSRPAYMGGLGFGLKWNMGWMHDVLDYMTKDTVYRRFHHNQLTFGLLYAYNENFILPFSHDEVTHGKGSLIGKMPGDPWQKFANLRLLFTFMAGHPGKILHFMGSEFGQFDEWNFQKSLDWHLLAYGPHWTLKEAVKRLNFLVRREPALHEIDFSHEGFQWINANDSDNSVLSFVRRGAKADDHLVFVLNFTPVPRYDYTIGVPASGFYFEIFNSDAKRFGGSGVGNGRGVAAWKEEGFGQPAMTRVTVPPLGGIILKPAAGRAPAPFPATEDEKA